MMSRVKKGIAAGFAATVVVSILEIINIVGGPWVTPYPDMLAYMMGMEGNHIMGWIGHVMAGTVVLGGLFGVAALSAYHTLRTKAHLMAIGDSVTLTNPIVAQAVQQRAAAYTGTIGDAALSQASGAGQLVQQASREAAVQAYNDVFLLIGILASLVFAAMFVQWLYNRHHGINPLASELQALQAMMSRSDS